MSCWRLPKELGPPVVADIAMLLFTVMHLIPSKGPFPGSTFGSFLCKFVYTNNITMVTLLATTLTLTLLVVERYHAMVKPLEISRRITDEKIAFVIIGISLITMAMVTPLFVSVDYRPNSRSLCSPGKNFDVMKVFVYCLVAILTLIPFFAIAFCYSRIISGLYSVNTICSRGQGISALEEMANDFDDVENRICFGTDINKTTDYYKRRCESGNKKTTFHVHQNMPLNIWVNLQFLLPIFHAYHLIYRLAK